MTEAGKFFAEMYEPSCYTKNIHHSLSWREPNALANNWWQDTTIYNIDVTLASHGARLWQDYKTKYILMICVTYSENAWFRHYISYIIYLAQTVHKEIIQWLENTYWRKLLIKCMIRLSDLHNHIHLLQIYSITVFMMVIMVLLMKRKDDW